MIKNVKIQDGNIKTNSYGTPSLTSDKAKTEYSKAFDKTVDNRINYWKKRSTKPGENPTYVSPNSHSEPKALKKVFKDVNDRKSKN